MRMKIRDWARERVILLICVSESSRLNIVTRMVNPSASLGAMGCAHW